MRLGSLPPQGGAPVALVGSPSPPTARAGSRPHSAIRLRGAPVSGGRVPRRCSRRLPPSCGRAALLPTPQGSRAHRASPAPGRPPARRRLPARPPPAAGPCPRGPPLGPPWFLVGSWFPAARLVPGGGGGPPAPAWSLVLPGSPPVLHRRPAPLGLVLLSVPFWPRAVLPLPPPVPLPPLGAGGGARLAWGFPRFAAALRLSRQGCATRAPAPAPPPLAAHWRGLKLRACPGRRRRRGLRYLVPSPLLPEPPLYPALQFVKGE